MEHDIMAAAREVVRRIMVREITSDHPDSENPNSRLHDFTKGFNGIPDDVPQRIQYEAALYEYRQKHQKAINQFTVANVYCFLDEAGNLTQQSDRNHFFIPAAYVDAYIAGMVAMRNAPDVPTDGNQPMNVPGQASNNLPWTERQQRVLQNELALKAIKKSR